MRSIVLFTVGVVALAGCAVETGPESTATSSEALTAFATPFAGSYTRTDGGLQLVDLTLGTDGTYSADNTVLCFRAPCPPVHVTGKWAVTGSGFTGTLKLTPKGGAVQSYAVTLDGAVGSLALVDSSNDAFEEVRSPKTCGGIGQIECTSGFTCVYPAVITHPDTAGQCVPRGGAGTTCGGIADLQCFEGLSCKITATHPDATGTCVVPKSAADCSADQKWCSILTSTGDKGFCTAKSSLCPL